MDRLDTWLNAQHGWRRLTLISVAWYPPTACLGFCLTAFLASWPPAPGAVLIAIAVLAVPGSVGFGSIMAALHSRRARNPGRKKGLPPFFMWRQLALPWVVIAGAAVGRIDPRNEDFVDFQMVSAIIVIALAVENVRYARRFTTPTALAEPSALADE